MSEYKFWNNDNEGVVSLISCDLRYVFNEVKECLESLNIKLSHDDIMRAYDMYLRFIGFMPDAESEEDINKPKGINCTFYPCVVPDLKKYIDDGTINPNVFTIGMEMMNDILPEKSRFEDITTVLDNVSDIFHEFSILTNDIIKKGYTMCNSVAASNMFAVSHAAYSCTLDWNNKFGIMFSVYKKNDLYDKHIMSITSSILAPVEDSSYVIVNFFPEEDREGIKKAIITNKKKPFKRITAEDIVYGRYGKKNEDNK